MNVFKKKTKTKKQPTHTHTKRSKKIHHITAWADLSASAKGRGLRLKVSHVLIHLHCL